jgi:hypothetical protein
MQLSLKTVNEELAKRGHTGWLEKGSGYFYFQGGETADWLDRSVPVRTLNTLTLKQWIEEFRRLKALNEQILRTAKAGRASKSTRRQ